MIIPNQKNIKVHFAGVETIKHLAIAKAAGVNYFLFSVFKLIAPEFNLKSVRFFENKTALQIPNTVELKSRHTIMDSGLFTLMFGSQKGKKDLIFLEKWQEKIIEFTKASDYNGVVVEIDCQKVFSSDEAWRFRSRLREALPNNRIINVFHAEDGQKGLDRLIEYSDYIALSIPELRIMKKKHYTLSLCEYIKNKKPDIDIHLLGCTERKMLKQMNFCSSADSSSWTSAVRYGKVETLQGKFDTNKFAYDKLDKKLADRLESVKKELGVEFTSDTYCGVSALACQHLKTIYANYAGEQE